MSEHAMHDRKSRIAFLKDLGKVAALGMGVVAFSGKSAYASATSGAKPDSIGYYCCPNDLNCTIYCNNHGYGFGYNCCNSYCGCFCNCQNTNPGCYTLVEPGC
jgi:hypothetical protein